MVWVGRIEWIVLRVLIEHGMYEWMVCVRIVSGMHSHWIGKSTRRLSKAKRYGKWDLWMSHDGR